MTTKILRWGNSLGVRIPKSVADETGVVAGTEVDFTVSNGELVIRPLKPARYSLALLIRDITPTNLHGEIETGEAVGREAW